MSNIISKTTINNLQYSFATHGLCPIIVTDNGTSFTSNEFKTFYIINGIKHITTAPCHSSSNDPVKRAVETFNSSIKKMREQSQ